MERRTGRCIGLALGGGGGRGSAHLGVIDTMEQLSVPIDMITGTSVGGLVGTLYAAGYSTNHIEALFKQATVRRIVARDPHNHGLIGTGRIEAWLRELLGNQTFADLRIPLAMVAVDLLTGDEGVLREGSLVEAVLATIAVPGFFPPRPRDGQLLVDGMLRNNVPVDIAQHLGAGKVVAVDLLAFDAPFALPALSDGARWSPRHWMPPLSQFTVLDRSLDILLRQLVEQRLRQHPPDILLRPTMPGLTPFDITRAAEGRAAGAASARAESDQLLELAVWHDDAAAATLSGYQSQNGPQLV